MSAGDPTNGWTIQRWLHFLVRCWVAAAALLTAALAQAAPRAASTNLPIVTFACIGDFGSDNPWTHGVASYIRSWKPHFVITVGDNNYPAGSAATIDKNIGQFYREFIFPYRGRYGRGAAVNRFFPALGNHDWITSNAAPYLAYFELPGNERYYSFVRGPVELFCVDSDEREPDGVTPGSTQGQWLQASLASSTSVWKVVYFHHSPYSSGIVHGSYTNETTYMRWPFKEWGASIVLSGHDHIYERLEVDGFPYIVNGLGGDSRDAFYTPFVPGSIKRFNRDVGVLRVDASPLAMTCRFFTRQGVLIDTLILRVSDRERPKPPKPGARAPAAAVRAEGTPAKTPNTKIQSSREAPSAKHHGRLDNPAARVAWAAWAAQDSTWRRYRRPLDLGSWSPLDLSWGFGSWFLDLTLSLSVVPDRSQVAPGSPASSRSAQVVSSRR